MEYVLTFVNGAVVRVKEIKNEYQPALKSSMLPKWKVPSEEEKRQIEEHQKENLTGRIMWLWWGGNETGYAGKVVAENSRELVVQREEERFEIVSRSSRDRILFDSYEDGKRYNDERKADWERKRKEYEEAIQTRAAERAKG
ncbi:MAG: hypothetical protein M3Y72_14750 [Acidobacteriota bacterium]|nr:hypothetical protein [Acidobacteriota bacterium]